MLLAPSSQAHWQRTCKSFSTLSLVWTHDLLIGKRASPIIGYPNEPSWPLGSRWDYFARTRMVISYLHDIWLKIKKLKCYMESTYNVTCMLCKLCFPSRWDSFVRIQMAIIYLCVIWLKCVIWNHVQCGSCMLCKCLPCLIYFGTMLIPFGTYFKLLHKIPKGTSMCMMTILWQLVTMHMKLVHVQLSNVHI